MRSNDLSEFIQNTQHNILDTILLPKYDANIGDLFSRLKSLKKPRYDANDRIVVVHDDPEYYYHHSGVGFTTHNLFTVIKALDIPWHVFIIVGRFPTDCADIDSFFNSPHDRPEILCPLIFQPDLYNEKIFAAHTEKNIRFHGMCLMGTPRSHRVKLYQFLKLHRLENKINFTFNSKKFFRLSGPADDVVPVALQEPSLYDIVYSHPHRTNETWCNFIDGYEELQALNQIEPCATENPHIGIDVQCYRQHGIDIVCETVFAYPCAWLTEKTMRTILMETPFIMLAPPGTLKVLHGLGIETFPDFWDESYDDIDDPRQRFLAVTKQIENFCDRSLDQVRDFYQTAKPRLQHNRQVVLKYIKDVIHPLFNKIKYVPCSVGARLPWRW